MAIGLERSQTSEAYRLRVARSGRASGDGETVATGVAGFTLARTWSVLLFSGSFPTAMILVLDLAWLAVLALPIGFWSPGWRSLTAATGGYLAGLVALPRLTTLLPASPSGYVAVLAGVAAGRWLSDLGVTFSQRYGVARATNRGNERESAGREDGGSAGFRGGCGTE